MVCPQPYSFLLGNAPSTLTIWVQELFFTYMSHSHTSSDWLGGPWGHSGLAPKLSQSESSPLIFQLGAESQSPSGGEAWWHAKSRLWLYVYPQEDMSENEKLAFKQKLRELETETTMRDGEKIRMAELRIWYQVFSCPSCPLALPSPLPTLAAFNHFLPKQFWPRQWVYKNHH